MDKYALAFALTICVFVFFILMFAVLGFVFWIRYSAIRLASKHAMRNHLFGPRETGDLSLPIYDVDYPEITHEFSLPMAKYGADLIARIEKLYHQRHDKLHNFILPTALLLDKKLYVNDRLFGVVATHVKSGHMWIAFRGTNQAQEWTEDFKFAQAQYQIYHGINQETFSERSTINCHTGFASVYELCNKKILECVEASNPTTIIITGHSLGAAVATLLAIRLGREFTVHLYTFASPRVCDHIPNVMSSFWRIQNTSDPIPTLPLAVMPNLTDPENPFFFTHGGKLVSFTDNLLSLSNNHLMATYINALYKGDLDL